MSWAGLREFVLQLPRAIFSVCSLIRCWAIIHANFVGMVWHLANLSQLETIG